MRDTGDVNLAAGVKLRTGTGSIELAAGRDLRFADSTAAIYTTGENRGTGGVSAGDTGFSADVIKELVFKADFLENGGDVRIVAGNDILGADGHQFINEWLTRVGGDVVLPGIGSTSLPASWAINVTNFAQNIGALGGGDVTVTADGNLDKLSVMIPTTAQPTSDAAHPAIAGGGDLRIDAGGDIKGGVFYLGQGHADIRAGGALSHAEGATVNPILSMNDGHYDVRAGKDLTIETVLNPTVLAQRNIHGDYMDTTVSLELESYFFTYSNNSAVRLESLAGDITLRGDKAALESVSDVLYNTINPSANYRLATQAINWYPGTLSARSLQGDIAVIGDSGLTLTLVPAPRGDLELLAGGSITTGGKGSVNLVLSDTDARSLPAIATPSLSLTNTLLRQGAHAPLPVHADDSQAVRIVARGGNIQPLEGSQDTLSFVLGKSARINAGGDVRDITLDIQNIGERDISTVEAGGDIRFSIQRDAGGKVKATDDNQFKIEGPGQFFAIAGVDVDLGASQGISSVGNQNNPALADRGAAINVIAGAKREPDYAGFIQRYFADSTTYRQRLANYLAQRGAVSSGVDAFRSLPLVEQRQLILEVFFTELRESGVAAAKKGDGDYSRGFTAIKTLFPADDYQGDIKSFLSRIYTLDGNDISLLAPGGLVNAGVASSAVINKEPGKLGIVAQRDGDIHGFVADDFLVNQSRVFALDGGDIVIWSSTGDIDAGRGAKTALSIPTPTSTTDANGNTVVELPPAVSGSGIRGAVSTPGRAPGDVYLFAPVGVVNAGDAGIGSAGNVTIGAVQVIGADNIDVGGVSVGVPLADTGSLTAGAAGLSDAAGTVTKDAMESATAATQQNTSSTPVADEALAFLQVEVLGFGEEKKLGDNVNEAKDEEKKDANE